MSENIEKITAKEIKDSRGNPTIRVTVYTKNFQGSFDVPSGASVGLHEAHELRDDDGGVKKAVELINNELSKQLKGISVFDQVNIDQNLINFDGTENKSKIGGNSMIGISIASLRAAAKAKGLEDYQYLRTLSDVDQGYDSPFLFVNLINGGKHAEGGSPFQEHQVVIKDRDVSKALKTAIDIQEKIENQIKTEGLGYSIGDEGGFVFSVDKLSTPFEFLDKSIKKLGLDKKVFLGADVAASTFYVNDQYYLFHKKYSAEDLISIYEDLQKEYNLQYIEDPFFEEDFLNFQKLKQSSNINVIADDLTTTNYSRIERAIRENSINSVIIKPNQIGTITETIKSIELATKNDINCIISHRSGENLDYFIADLTKAFNCFGIKSGAWGKPEREIKYNRLIDLYE